MPPRSELWGHSCFQTRLLLLISDVALDKHVPLRVSPVSPYAEWGSFSHLLPRSLGLRDPRDFQLGLVSHGACALRLPKGRIQCRADLAQNGAETGLDGLWDLGKDTPLPAFSRPHPQIGGLKGRLEGRLLLYERVVKFLVLFFHRDSGSTLPAWLLWVAEHIMAPCIQATALKMQPWMQLIMYSSSVQTGYAF